VSDTTILDIGNKLDKLMEEFLTHTDAIIKPPTGEIIIKDGWYEVTKDCCIVLYILPKTDLWVWGKDTETPTMRGHNCSDIRFKLTIPIRITEKEKFRFEDVMS
jgi:hypothetical protein